MGADEANNLPDSEVVPSALQEVTSILRVAHDVHPTHPRIAYLCVCGALEETIRVDPFARTLGVHPFRNSLWFWIDANGGDTIWNGKLGPSDARALQSFYLDYYEKNILELFNFLEANKDFIGEGPSPMPLWPTPRDGVQASTSFKVRSDRVLLLTSACPSALSLYKVLELLSKDVQLPPQILEAHNEVKRLAQIFRPYSLIPNDPYSERTPEIRAIENAFRWRGVSSKDVNVPKKTQAPLPDPLEAVISRPWIPIIWTSVIILFLSFFFFHFLASST